MVVPTEEIAKESLISALGLSSPQAAKLLPADIRLVEEAASYDDIAQRSMILCTARSGSSLLSVALQAYGFDFQEYLNAQGAFKRMLNEHAPRDSHELGLALKTFATKNGRISIKAPPSTLPMMFFIRQFPTEFKKWKFVYLRRQNLVRQAISSVIATKTGQWTHVMKATGSVSVEDYNYTAILNMVNALGHTNRLIERFIGVFDLDVMNVIYEEFVTDQKAHLARIAQHFGTDPADYPEANAHKPWLEKQATELNSIWEERFRNELTEKTLLPVDAGGMGEPLPGAAAR